MNFLFLTILFPVFGFVLLVCLQRSLPQYLISGIGIGSIALSVLITFFIAVDFLVQTRTLNKELFFIQPIFTWISTVDFCVSVGLRLDGLSLNMLIMITVISLLIYIYSSWYMSDSASYGRFVAYMNLFVANMIILVLADNLLLMYLGWEGVGLCSYLLIGFYYKKLKNGEAALKSLIMTRIGDVFLICAIFMLYKTCHTLDFSTLRSISSNEYFGNYQNFITVCLLVAAVSKSAQLPFQSWLSDAMVAPPPVSALIHAATMVTAGVYLIARTYNLFIITPEILYLMGVIGSITLIISSCSALVQNDIKKILAYSTMGQIGYMFIALSVQAWEVAIFHLMMHAFFKALLFLAAGSLIFFCCGEQNIFKMNGLSYKVVPLIYSSFLVGGASLSAFPIITSGFYSKGAVLLNSLLSGSYLFMIAGLIGSFLTVLYTFRMIFVIFHKNFSDVAIYQSYSNSFVHYFPLIILIVLSSVIGIWIRIPIYTMFSQTRNVNSFINGYIFECCVSVLVFVGFGLSFIYYVLSYCAFFDRLLNYKMGQYFLRCCFLGWGFNWLYKKIFIKPYLFIVYLISFDPFALIFKNFFIFVVDFFSNRLILSENGQLRYYVTSMILGVVTILLILIFL